MVSINYTASPTAVKFHADDNFGRFIIGPFGSGKTTIGLMEVFLRALKQQPDQFGRRRTRALIVRNSYPELRSTTIPSFISWFHELAHITYGSPITAEIVLPLPDGTTVEETIYFIGLDDEASSKKLLSLEVTFAFLDEFIFIPEQVMQVISGRVGRFPEVRRGGPSWRGFWGTSNPCPVNHWYYVLAEEKRPPGYSFYRQPPGLLRKIDERGREYYVTNPEAENLSFLPEGYYEKMAIGKDDDFIRVYLMGDYGRLRSGKPVFAYHYDDSVHYTQNSYSPDKSSPIFVGVDLGLGGCAAVFTQLLPTGTLVVFDELFFKDMSVYEFVENRLYPHVKTRYFGHNVILVADPAAWSRSPNDKKSAVDILREFFGSSVERAPTNDQVARIEAVNYFLSKKNGFVIAGPAPSMLRRGMLSEYKFERKSNNPFNEMLKDKPEKNEYSHCADALQYVAVMLKFTERIKKSTLGYSYSIENYKRYRGDSIAGY